ncbi:MAG TPA: CaiB/BaiF CoA-transferase family protein [Acidimicrobiia bacterium]|nr:CaiB/BaiF CoA-transferase family protein [Acidimicrobiia bacterium]
MKLDGVTVVDLSLFLPGPHLTMMMADHGADVIKVEPYDGGEPGRRIGPAEDGETIFFRNTHRGKRSLRLNLKHPEGREILLRLAERADVLVESFRPGVVDRLGVGYAAVSERAPHIVYCSISAFGQTGPYRDRPAHDLAVEAMAGLVSVNLGPDDRPAMPGIPAADMAGSLMALAGILMALLRQRITGRGDYVDIAMHDALLAWTANVMGPVFTEGRPPVPKEERTWGGNAFYNLYETSDGHWIALGASEPKFADSFLGKAGRSDLSTYAHRPPGQQGPLIAYLRGLFKERTLAEWLTWLDGMDVGYAPVRTLAESIDDPNTAHRHMVLVDERGRRHLGVPIRFASEPAQPRLVTPTFGEHTDAIVASLGYDHGQIERLRTELAIG